MKAHLVSIENGRDTQHRDGAVRSNLARSGSRGRAVESAADTTAFGRTSAGVRKPVEISHARRPYLLELSAPTNVYTRPAVFDPASQAEVNAQFTTNHPSSERRRRIAENSEANSGGVQEHHAFVGTQTVDEPTSPIIECCCATSRPRDRPTCL